MRGMMRTGLYSFLILTLSSILFAAQSEFRDGRIVFVKQTVNGSPCWTDEECQKFDKVINDYNLKTASDTIPIEIVTIVPEEFEVNLSTCVLKWKDWPQYKSIVDGNKSLLLEKSVEVKKKRDDYSDFPESAEYIDYKQRYDWLKSFYESLP